MAKYSSEDYDLIDNDILQFRIDYQLFNYKLNIEGIFKILDVELIPYSSMTDNQLKSIDNYNCKDAVTLFHHNKKTTYYNDKKPKNRIRFTLAHEIKHIIYNEKDPNEKEEEMANHFAKEFLAPSCLVMRYVNESPNFISNLFGISFEVSTYVLESAISRSTFNKNHLSDIEREFITYFDKK